MDNYVSAFHAGDELGRLEQSYDLLRYEFDGWCIWPLFRFQAGLILNRVPISGHSSVKLLNHVQWLLGDLIAWFSMHPAEYLAKTYTSGLLERAEDGYKDIWFDDVLDEIGSGLKIEGVNNSSFIERRLQAVRPSVMTVSTLHFLARILSRLKIGPSGIDELASTFNAELSQIKVFADKLTPGFVASQIRVFYWQKFLYKQLLWKVRPRFVFVVDPGEFSLVAASKECRIPVIEFQHGFVNHRTHYSYSWTKYASIYKNRMPLPDKLFLYGDYWKQDLEHNGFWGDALRVVGSPRIDNFRRRRAKHHNGKLVLVYTAQGIDTLNVANFLGAFLDTLRPHNRVTLYIKLHPIHDSDPSIYINRFDRDSFTHVLLGNDDPSTFELLTQADLHLSISSTCHYDALALGVPTVILPLATHEIVMPLYESNHAFYVKNPAELVDLVLRLGTHEIPLSVSEYYFKPDALNNIKHELGLVA